MTYPLIILLLILRSFYWCISLVAQLVKNLPAMQETPVWFLGWEDSLREGIGYLLQYSWASLVVQLVKNLPAIWETWFNPWVEKIPWRREQLPTLVFWLGEFYGLYHPWGHKELDMTERFSLSLLSSEQARVVWILNGQCIKRISPIRSFPGGASGKESSCQCKIHKRLNFDPWVMRIPWSRKMAPHSSILVWKIPWTEEPDGLHCMGPQRLWYNWAQVQERTLTMEKKLSEIRLFLHNKYPKIQWFTILCCSQFCGWGIWKGEAGDFSSRSLRWL